LSSVKIGPSEEKSEKEDQGDGREPGKGKSRPAEAGLGKGQETTRRDPAKTYCAHLDDEPLKSHDLDAAEDSATAPAVRLSHSRSVLMLLRRIVARGFTDTSARRRERRTRGAEP
jgi:hypothetical protein